MKVTNLRLNGIKNPIGFQLEKVLASWKTIETSAKKQKSAKIELAEKADFSDARLVAEGNLKCNETELKIDLKPYTTYYWRVTVEADNGETATSEPAYFETGKMDAGWDAKWIAAAEEDTFHPEFHKSVELATKPKRARLYICGLGLFEASLNGEKIGNEFLTPYINDYEDSFQTITFDVTEQLKAGENDLSVILGDGWYKGVFGLTLQPNQFGDRMCVIAELRIEDQDGKVTVIPTDSSWNYQGSDVAASGIYLGETLDRTLYEGKENPVKTAEEIQAPKHGKLVDRYSLPVVIKETIEAKEIIHTPAGETVIDFGQNHAGVMSFTADFPAGTRVTFECAEILQEGNFYHDNYREAESKFTYISDGRKEEVRPRFTFFGYRYLKVTGWPGDLKLSDVKADVLYSDMDRTGFIETSNEKINRLYLNALWGQKSNFVDMPTDCPQRSERLGWTGDAQVFTPTASLNMDTRAFYHKFFKDLYTDQKRAGGAVASFIPSFGEVGGSSIWADVATMSPNAVFNAFGNIEEMKLYYPMMKEWVEWMYRKDEQEEGGSRRCISRFTFGDWLGLDGITEQSFKGGTEDEMLDTAYYYQSTKITAEMAERLGYLEDGEKYTQLAKEIKKAFLAEYFTPNGRYAQDTQAAYIVALKFGLYENKDRLIEGFKKRLQKDCYEIKCGFVGAPLLCLTLCENGMEDLAYHFLFKENFPSWLYCVNLGATTIWERWNSLLPDGTCSGTGMNSFNHYSYGSVVQFMYEYIGGIRPASAGYKRAILAPLPNMHFQYFKCSYDSVNGKYVSNWTIGEDGKLTMEVTVPFNCTALLKFPRYNGQAIAGAEGLSIAADGSTEIDAGSYVFTYLPAVDYRFPYNMGTRLGELDGDQNALKILEENLPIAYGMLMSHDKENLNLTFGEMQFMGFIGFKMEEVQKTVSLLEKVDCYNRYQM